jgi:hypothetical protein
MPNQNNFRSDVVTISDPRFIASRIVSFPEEEILYESIPASFGYDIFDNIEIHFYSVPNNNLLLSTLIDASDSDILKSHIVSYEDGTFKNYIRIDFTRLFEKKELFLRPGDYKIVINFFADEIGSYNNRKLYLQDISESRTEVEVAFFDTQDIEDLNENLIDLREFILPSFSRPTAIGVAEKIFRSGVRSTDTFRDEVGLTYNNILDNIELPGIDQTENNTLGRIRRLSSTAETEFSNQIEQFLPVLYEKIREEIVIRGDRRIQEDEFKEFIEEVVDSEIRRLQEVVDRRILIN